MKIFLIGLPGSGKTTLGKQVAQSLQIPFVDLDEEIEKLNQKSVREIFAEDGEKNFRIKESECLKALANSEKRFVLATGGGAPCFFDNMQVMNATGTTIFLNAPLEEVAERLKRSNLEKRPLFKNLGNNEVIEQLKYLYQQRHSFYSEAKKILSAKNISIKDILLAIKE